MSSYIRWGGGGRGYFRSNIIVCGFPLKFLLVLLHVCLHLIMWWKTYFFPLSWFWSFWNKATVSFKLSPNSKAESPTKEDDDGPPFQQDNMYGRLECQKTVGVLGRKEWGGKSRVRCPVDESRVWLGRTSPRWHSTPITTMVFWVRDIGQSLFCSLLPQAAVPKICGMDHSLEMHNQFIVSSWCHFFFPELALAPSAQVVNTGIRDWDPRSRFTNGRSSALIGWQIRQRL